MLFDSLFDILYGSKSARRYLEIENSFSSYFHVALRFSRARVFRKNNLFVRKRKLRRNK